MFSKIRYLVRILYLIVLGFIFSASLNATTLQEMINQTPEGGILMPPSGVYNENIVINKSIVLDGQKQVSIKGLGNDSVILVNADRVAIKNLTISGSGNRFDNLDAGIKIKPSSNHLITGNNMHDILFGIDLNEVHNITVSNNKISTFPAEHVGLRGDSIRLWASNHNNIKNNIIHDSRDIVVWYSDNNILEENIIYNSRYGIHFMYTGFNTIRNNTFRNNMVGVFLMYGEGAVLEGNDISYSIGSSGMGIGLKEMSDITIKNNRILYSSIGIYVDQSPFQPDTANYIEGNTISFNTKGILFHSNLENNFIRRNIFSDNLKMVSVNSYGSATNNLFEENYWNDYQGFDTDEDTYGDFDYRVYSYLDYLWLNNSWIRFYFASPILTVLNFLSELVPLTEPRLIMFDEKPVMQKTVLQDDTIKRNPN